MSAVQAQKKPGGAGVKLFQAIKAVNQGCSVTLPSRCSCKIILGVFRQKEYQQFRLKKPGGAGVKLFQAILAVNRDPGGTPVTPAGDAGWLNC